MSTDPLGEAIGRSEPAAPGAARGYAASAEPAGAPSGENPAPGPGPSAPGPYEAPSAYEPGPAQPAWPEPEAERPLLERRPEILVGAALAGGFVAAQLLGRIRGR